MSETFKRSLQLWLRSEAMNYTRIRKWKTMQTISKAIVNSKKTKTQEKKKYNQII